MIDQELTYHTLRKRISAFMFAIFFLFIALFVRLFCVVVLSSQNLQQKAYDQWTRDLPITAERGKITDTNGTTLAVSYSTYDIYTRGREVKDANKVATLLSQKLGLNYDDVVNKVSIKNVSEILIKLQVDSKTAKEIQKENLDGIFLSESIKRYYPYGDLLTQIIGFTTVDNVGQSGIEAYYNDILAGTDGSFVLQSDLQGKELKNSLRSYISATSGANIQLTIDVNIQKIVEKTLEKAMQEQKSVSASCIIMDAQTGEIVASSTKPSFDLNNIPRNDTQNLMSMTKNKLVVDVFEPGSTFKILTMSSALESGTAKLTDHFYCGGASIVDGQRIKCWRSIGHGSQDLTTGLVNSCNCVFMALAQRMGTEKFYSYLRKFGLGQKTGVNIASESSGILMNEKSVKNVDLARIGFGQAIAVTPLQLVTAVCSAVNGGNLYTPTIVKSIQAGENTTTFSKNLKGTTISETTSKTLNEMLKKVVNKKTEYSFISGFDVGGKTATAQKYQNGAIARGKYVSSFIGTYPASDPEYVMLFMVDEPSAGAYYGSVVAMPYAKQIFTEMFEYLGEKPITEQKPEYVTMPNLVGLTLTKAIEKLRELGLDYEIDGEGGIITKQLPPFGTQIDKTTTILLIT